MPENRYAIHPDHFKTLDTGKIRESFLMTPIFTNDVVTQFYTHYDRLKCFPLPAPYIAARAQAITLLSGEWREKICLMAIWINQTSRFEIALTERK